MNYYAFPSHQTTHHLSPRKFLPQSVKEFLIFHVTKSALIKRPLISITHLRPADLTKITSRPPQRRKRSRHILLFISNVKINISKICLPFLDKHFPKHRKYYKLFNRNNVKVSYSCIQNMTSVIQNHSTNLLKDPVAPIAKSSGCKLLHRTGISCMGR